MEQKLVDALGVVSQHPEVSFAKDLYTHTVLLHHCPDISWSLQAIVTL